MAKTFEKAVTGFNHNIKHKGRVYHVQTEDSGVNNPHIITHLFVGGNILASKKTSYADIVNAENLAEVVRELMEEQHKEMLRNLINGVYDNIEDAGRATHYQPGQLASDEQASRVKMQAGRSIAPTPPPLPVPPSLPPEVLAARAMKEHAQDQRDRRRDALRRGPDLGEEPRRGDLELPRGRGRAVAPSSPEASPTRAGLLLRQWRPKPTLLGWELSDKGGAVH